MRKTKTILFIILSFISYLTFSTSVQANSNGIPFEISPIIPDDQKENKGYFDFEITDNFNKTLYIQARNLMDHPITLLITPINASTSSFGQISYNVNAKENQFIDLKVPLSQVITYEKNITIPANSTENIPLEIQLQHVENGTVLGGIHVVAENETVSEEEVKKGEATFQVKNQIAYVIGVKMQTTTILDPEFSFGKVKMDMEQRKPRLLIEMKNSAAAVIKNLNGTYVVNDEDGNQIIEGSFSNMKMAPNTRFEYAVNWVEGKVESGTYHIKLSAEADGEKINAEKQFVIKDTEPIKEYNTTVKTTEQRTSSIPWWSYVITAGAAGVIFFFIGKRSNRKK